MKIGNLASTLGVSKTEVYNWLRTGTIIYEVSRRSGINFLALMEETGYEFEKLVNFYLGGSIDNATKNVRRKRNQKIRQSDVETPESLQDKNKVWDSGKSRAKSFTEKVLGRRRSV